MSKKTMDGNLRRAIARAKRLRPILVEVFPACFAPKGADKLPLKVGIDADILTAFPEMSRADVKAALRDYTNGPTYLRNVVEGADRIGLDGASTGKVTACQAEYAAERLEYLRQQIEAQAAA